MRARLQFMMALTGMSQKPHPRVLALEQLDDVTPSVSVMTEALNHATLVLPGEHWGHQAHYAHSPQAITRDSGIVPPAGMYAPSMMFMDVPGGFSVAAREEGPDTMKERVFTVTVNDKGGFDFRTHGLDHGVVRKETLADTNSVITYFGEWMRRNFTGGTLRHAETWLPVVMAEREAEAAAKAAMAPAGKGPAAATLTA